MLRSREEKKSKKKESKIIKEKPYVESKRRD
jgi:hypothetical protein